MSIRASLAALALLLVGVACGGGGGSSGGTATFTGTVRGNSFKTGDAVSATNVLIATQGSLADCTSNADCTTTGETCIAGSCGARSGTVAAIVLTSATGLCSKVSASQEPKSTQYFVLALGEVDYNTRTVTPPSGAFSYAVTYTGLPPTRFAKILFQGTDASCKAVSAQGVGGVNGTVQLTRADANGYTGTFDLNLQQTDASGHVTGTADHVTGTFNTTNCAGLAGLVATNRHTTCM